MVGDKIVNPEETAMYRENQTSTTLCKPTTLFKTDTNQGLEVF